MLSGLCWRSLCRDNEAVCLLSVFPHSVVQPVSVQMPCMSGLHVPAERSRSISDCAHPHLSPNTSAKWNSESVECRNCWDGGGGIQPGMEGLALLGKPGCARSQ